MNYEKKYKEALKRAKDALNDGTISSNTIAYLHDIFPKLKESEDEKIRKAPEKLYFGESDKSVLEIYSTKESNDEVEYTRTDAFIEKACKFLFENYHGEKLSLRMIEDFRNYMKDCL